MHQPGPWFIAPEHPDVIVNLYHSTGIGRYSSQYPLRKYGGYPVIKVFEPWTALEVVHFPTVVRALHLAVNDKPEAWAAFKQLNPEVATVIETVTKQVGNDLTPTEYRMGASKWDESFDPRIYAEWKRRHEEHGQFSLLKLMEDFQKRNPFRPFTELWQ